MALSKEYNWIVLINTSKADWYFKDSDVWISSTLISEAGSWGGTISFWFCEACSLLIVLASTGIITDLSFIEKFFSIDRSLKNKVILIGILTFIVFLLVIGFSFLSFPTISFTVWARSIKIVLVASYPKISKPPSIIWLVFNFQFPLLFVIALFIAFVTDSLNFSSVFWSKIFGIHNNKHVNLGKT